MQDDETPDALRELGERIRQNEPLSKHGSLRIGGPARWWAEVETLDELRTVAEWAVAEQYDMVVVGLGSNTLYPDEGIEGVVVRLGGTLAEWHVRQAKDGHVAEVGAGTINAHLVRGLHREGFTGMEFLSLIPGTFGGAIAMNAGTREKELSSILRSVTLWLPETPGKVVTMSPAEIDMRYRHSELPPRAIVVGGVIALEEGDVEAAKKLVKQDKDRRNETQPYRLASVGSTFANPPGDAAGRLIDSVGLKGRRQGGARISDLHANFFINEDDATSEDFIGLMALARLEVRRRYGVELRPEVQFVGFDGWSKLDELERRFEEEEGDSD